MKQLVYTVLCIGFAMLHPAGLNAAPGVSLLDGPDKTDHATVTLVTDVASITPGEPFRLGVRFELEPDWHIYWENSGDTGLQTKVQWVLPEGFTAGPLQYPVPEKFEVAGLVTYGYHDEVVVYSEVTPPADLAGGKVELSADAVWLICKEICLKGDASLSLMAPVGAGGGASAQAGLFEAMQARVPRQESKHIRISTELENYASGVIRLTAEPNSGWRIEETDSQKRRAEFFPHLNDGWVATHAQVDKLGGEGVEFRWPVERNSNAGEKSAVLRGVMRVPLVNAAGEQALEVVEVAVAAPDDTALAADDAGESGVAAGPGEGQAATGGDGGVAGGETGTMDSAGGGDAMSNVEETDGAAIAGAGAGQRLSFLDERPAANHSLIYYLLLAFLGGIILNVMPCVLPVISLKVMGFVNQAGESPRKILAHGLVFAAGVLASFLVLALVLVAVKQTAALTGWGFQFQNPQFVIVMSVVVLAFGLSMLGVFEVDLPWKAQKALGQASEAKPGMAGSFTNGVMATALSTPCSAPFLGPALGFALGQSAAWIVVFLLTIGLGLAFPYVLLSANPRWLRRLPKPGPWMDTFKQAMGFLLLGMVVWLLMVLNGQLGGEGVIVTLMFLLVVGIGCWLYGLLSDPLKRGRGRARAFALPVLAVLVLGGYIALPAKFLSARESFEAVRPAAAAEVNTSTDHDGGIAWQPFSVEHVERLVADNKTVFVDFTADWCWSCKINEKVALETDAVRSALSDLGVTPVKADWTNNDEAIGSVLAQLGRNSVPTYVIFPAGRADRPMVLNETLTAGYVVDKLREATASGPVTQMASRP